MNDKRYDNRPRLNYTFSSGKPLEGEQRVSAGFKSKRPSKGSAEPRGTPAVNMACSPSGKFGKEFTHRRRDKAEADNLLRAAFAALGDE